MCETFAQRSGSVNRSKRTPARSPCDNAATCATSCEVGSRIARVVRQTVLHLYGRTGSSHGLGVACVAGCRANCRHRSLERARRRSAPDPLQSATVFRSTDRSTLNAYARWRPPAATKSRKLPFAARWHELPTHRGHWSEQLHCRKAVQGCWRSGFAHQAGVQLAAPVPGDQKTTPVQLCRNHDVRAAIGTQVTGVQPRTTSSRYPRPLTVWINGASLPSSILARSRPM